MAVDAEGTRDIAHPGALFFDLNHCVRPSQTLPRNIPDPTCFQEYVQKLGVNRNTHLITYDRGAMLSASRAWWTFKVYGHSAVSVLDGGLNEWISDGYETAQQQHAPQPQTGNFSAAFDRSLIRNYAEMLEEVKNRSTQIVDARRPENFLGEEHEPTQFTMKALEGMGQDICHIMARGHIPGALNILEDLLLNPDTKCLLPKEDLIKIFDDMGVDLSRPITTMCYNGHAATLLALATYVCGKHATSVYYGSWTEWGQRAPDNMVVGPENISDGER